MPAKRRKRAPAPLKLSSLRQIQALADPLRFRAFERLIEAPLTGKQLALLLRKRPTHLYHHLRVLERAGLIRQVATKKKRGTTERYYQAVSDRVVVDERLLGRKVATRHALIGQVLRVTLDEFIDAEALAGGKSPAPRLVKRLRIRASRKQIDGLAERLEEWLVRFESASDPAANDEYAVTVALYPLGPANPR